MHLVSLCCILIFICYFYVQLDIVCLYISRSRLSILTSEFMITFL